MEKSTQKKLLEAIVSIDGALSLLQDIEPWRMKLLETGRSLLVFAVSTKSPIEDVGNHAEALKTVLKFRARS